MDLNPYLNELGFDKLDRVVIIHADDVGMCQATISAFSDLIEGGLLSSGAVMVPCPWFLEAAAYSKKNPQADMGVHLTLTSEWSTYRWNPVSTCDPDSDLIDEQGYFFHRAQQVHRYSKPEAVQIEINAQLSRAFEAGINVTHLDTHMGTLMYPKLLDFYIKLGQYHSIPVMVPKDAESSLRFLGLDQTTVAAAARYINGNGIFGELVQIDHLAGLRLDQPEDRLSQAKAVFKSLKPGLTHLAIHPARDTPELRAATPLTWECRVGDYEVFGSEALRSYIRELGIQMIGYEPLRDLLRSKKIQKFRKR